MQIETLATNPSVSQRRPVFQPDALQPVQRDRTPMAWQRSEMAGPLSELAQFALSYEFTELSFNRRQTQVAYRSRDGSLAMRATSQTDVQLQQERVSLDLTFSAEALGLTAEDFAATDGKPIQFSLTMRHTEFQLDYRANTRIQRPLRKPAEILQDLAEVLKEVLQEEGDKDILVMLDAEAIKSLTQDEKFSKLLEEIFALIGVINSLKLHAGARDKYSITVSGKGQPYIDHQEHINVEGKMTTMELKISILPPATEEQPAPAEAASEEAR